MHSVRFVLALAAAIFALAQGPSVATAAETQLTSGVWRNPKNSVHVELRRCGEGLCGNVVWASPKARADAREGGTENLIGLQLFRGFVRMRNGVWKGKVFVPDLNRTVAGTAETVDAQSFRAKRCLVAGVGCKSQIWTRAGDANFAERAPGAARSSSPVPHRAEAGG